MLSFYIRLYRNDNLRDDHENCSLPKNLETLSINLKILVNCEKKSILKLELGNFFLSCIYIYLLMAWRHLPKFQKWFCGLHRDICVKKNIYNEKTILSTLLCLFGICIVNVIMMTTSIWQRNNGYIVRQTV